MKYIVKITCCALLAASSIMTGCTLFGLDLQTDYDYKHTAFNPKLSMDAWSFMQSRPDLFSSLLEAIDYVKDVDPELVELYKRPDNTYFLLTNRALTDIAYIDAWTMLNKVSNPDAEEWADRLYFGVTLRQYPKQNVINLLRYHIVKGSWGMKTMKSTPTWYDTYASGDTAKINIYLHPDREAYVYVNNYTGHPTMTGVERYRVPNPDDPTLPGTITYWLTDNNPTVVNWNTIRPRTADLEATNGYVHVMDRYSLPPTRQILGL